jgi:NADPH-dependent curcumin reductase
MAENTPINRRIVLNSRPVGASAGDDFRLEEGPGPKPGPGQEYALSDGCGLTRLDADMARPSTALGVPGMPGFTACRGLLDIGKPKAGETVVVAAVSGAVGSVVGQIARMKGCRAVGIAGGADKCRFVVDELGFDACVDHRSCDFQEQLAAACPKGIDLYFESVGGRVFAAILPLLNVKTRVPLCGLIAPYNDTGLPEGPDRLGLLARTMLVKRIKMQAFIGLLEGRKFGKLVIRVAGD